jgi:hypothetical protein
MLDKKIPDEYLFQALPGLAITPTVYRFKL